MKPTGDLTREIFDELRAGGREAFDRFFEHETPRILVYINYNLGPRLRHKVEPGDILQNLYLRIYRSFDSFFERVQERGLHRVLIRMADHEITEAYRYHFKVDKRDARREVYAGYAGSGDEDGPKPFDWAPADQTSISQKVVQQEEYQRVMSMLGDLSLIEQYVTVAKVIEGVPTREIAARLGKTRGAIQMVYLRVRNKLRERLAEVDGEDLPPPEDPGDPVPRP